MSNQIPVLPVNENKVIDRTIDIYLGFCNDLNTAEVIRLGNHLIELANRRATDVELEYVNRRLVLEHYYGTDDIYPDLS